MLESDSLGELEDRILRAIQWAGRAFVDSRREESFLLMAIALESLLLRSQKDENIGYKIALRCAHLIGLPDVAARKSLVKDVRELYARRSAIVHSGKIEVSDSELASLRHYLRAALFVVINKEPFSSMTDENEFEAWFEAPDQVGLSTGHARLYSAALTWTAGASLPDTNFILTFTCLRLLLR